MSLSTVDLDVLTAIIALLSPSDARSLSLTTRALYPAAQRHALSTVVLDKPSKLSRAHEYLLADVPNRSHYIRKLTVTHQALNSPSDDNVDDPLSAFFVQSARLLADLLESTQLLTTISVASMEQIIRAEPRVWNALTALSFLTNVELKDAHAGVLSRLGEFRGPLRKLEFCGSPDSYMLPGKLPFSQLVKAWCAYPRLQHIGLDYVPKVDYDRERLSSCTPCQTVLNLDVSHSELPLSGMTDMLPNLRSLSILNTKDYSEDNAGKCWSRLARLDFRTQHGPSDSQHHWVITSRTRQLVLLHSVETDPNRYWNFRHFYASTVEDAQPVALCLSTCPSVGEDFWTGLVREGRRLRCLDIRLRAGWKCHKDVSEWLDKVPRFWTDSDLLYVRIFIRETDFLSRMNTSIPFREDDAAAMAYVKQTVSAHLLACVPTVRLIAIKLMNETSWWRAQQGGEGGPRHLVPISSDVGHHVETYLYSEEFEQSMVFDGECTTMSGHLY
ncbi:uncharacterized protein B0H18DRAFT_991563 [Fomitopsis serialis]|uniref:uncharacterized protein n=1 Tax=Fomitopsis serialis TaxID=139415 RepID=UPI0020078D07|nr:uncharacterized protein B0H18DRAFT_991563 [Neoantrodia serialis]KAH9930846.1 hypothetical protein B0H18DRAFT_991563 [Neoantrodia serialis]